MVKEISLEKKARALSASVRLKDQYYDEKIEAFLSNQFDVSEATVSSMILKKFLGDEYWKVRELKYRRNEYIEKSKDERFSEDRPMYARDYFDIPTQYHFYKYMQMVALITNASNQQYQFNILKNSNQHTASLKRTIPFVNNGERYSSLAELLEDAFERYSELDGSKNMFFSRSDIKVNIDSKPIGSYKSLRKLAQAESNDSGENVESVFQSLKYKFESDVFDYMVSYLRDFKRISELNIRNIVENKDGENYLSFSTKPEYTYIIGAAKKDKSRKESEASYEQITIQDYVKRSESVEPYQVGENVDLDDGIICMEDDGQFKFSHFKYKDPLKGFEDYWPEKEDSGTSMD